MSFHSVTSTETINMLKNKPCNPNEKNVLCTEKKKSLISRFFSQFSDFMIIILLLCAAVSFAVSYSSGEGDFADPAIILIIVILNAAIGTFEEGRADKALEALKKMSAPTARVRRGGKISVIPAEELKIGDILLLSPGDRVGADARLIKSVVLEADESALTGEAMPVSKDADVVLDALTPLAERKNMVFSATGIVSGSGEAIVTAIGMNTETGKIAKLISLETEEQTPLQKNLTETGQLLGLGALIICAVIFLMGIFRHLPPLSMLLTSISLAVAAIPEGLPAIVTIVLAIGVQKMAKHKAVVKRLSAVEALGGASVICADKTGTLTENRMSVAEYVTDDSIRLFELAALCCDSEKSPTEAAILKKACELGIKTEHSERISEIPFDSNRKLMSVMISYYSAKRIITKGAAEILLSRCTHYIKNDQVLPISPFVRRRILSDVKRMGEKALRVIGVAYKDTHFSHITENELIFAGLIGLADPPRPEVRAAVAEAIGAGIRPVMITGDNITTALAIAEAVGIRGKSVSGAELTEKSDRALTEYSIFARVTPQDKMRIVKAFKSGGNIVAMTGDGVNDAPALRAADIGCSMGRRGTEVAKEASDLVLADDNFATIVAAVREGRGIFDNIKKSIQFLLSSNIGEVLTVFCGMLFGWDSPLSAIQLLWVNLVTDSLPAIALGMDPKAPDIMQRNPRAPGKSLFSVGLWAAIVLEGCMIGALSLLAFSVGHNIFSDDSAARTMAFSVLSLSQLFHSFNMRSAGSILSREFFANKLLVLSLLLGVFLQILAVRLPLFSVVFKTSALSTCEWTVVFVLSVLPIVIIELQKLISNKK